MAIKLPDQPWNEGDSFVVDETGLEYTYNGEVWVSEGKEIDLSGLAEEDHTHSEYLKKSGTQTLDNGRWLLRHPKADGSGTYSYIEIDTEDNLGLYHLKTPTNDVHAANKKYVDDNTSLGRPFVYGNSDVAGGFVMASGSTSIYFNKTDANGRVRRHRHAPDFQWNTELKYTIWDENGVLAHAGLTGLSTDYTDDKLQFKQCRPLYDMGLVADTTYYVNLEGYW